jgi:glycerol-3-phosphate dehydrogenase
LLLDAKESIRICNEVATIMAELLGKDNQWIEIQVADFTSLASKYVLK